MCKRYYLQSSIAFVQQLSKLHPLKYFVGMFAFFEMFRYVSTESVVTIEHAGTSVSFWLSRRHFTNKLPVSA